MNTVFAPTEGAVLDLDSLHALAQAPAAVLTALGRLWGSSSLVIEGLDLSGEWAPAGPPGTRRPDARAPAAVISPGVALVQAAGGAPYLVSVPQEIQVPWPTQAGPAVRGVLVLVPRIEPVYVDGVPVACQRISAEIGFVRPDQAEQPHLLPLAAAVGNGRDWATDQRRVWQPEHTAIQMLLRRLDQLENTIWKAEPEGSVWDRQVLGRNWVRYQTVASSAVQSTRMILSTQASTTTERVRLVGALYDQLVGSVERAANELLQALGTPEGAGPYRAVGSKRTGDLR